MTNTQKTVLVTCPPMLGLIDEFRWRFDTANIELVTPDVVQVLAEDTLCELLPDVDGWIIGDDPATRRVLSAGREGRLKACVKWGVGTDNVDFEAAHELNLQVTNTPGVFGKEVADIAMNYVSGLARETFLIDRQIRSDMAWPKPCGISLEGKTVALVGLGDIGIQTAIRLRAADMRIVGFDPFAKRPLLEGIEHAPWPERIEEADFVVFTCPLTTDTHHMFNQDLVKLLKPGVRIVNVSRGPVVDEVALAEALAAGTVHSAALDVFEVEPLPKNSPLRGFENCIFGSHNGSNTRDAVERVSYKAIDLMFSFLDAE